METSAKKGNKNAKAALDLANSPNEFLSTVQIGITLIGILTGIYSGDKVTEDVKLFISQFEVLAPDAQSIAVGVVVVTLTFFSLVLGELLPKRIGLNYPESIAKSVALPMKVVSKVTMPFIWLLTKSTDFILKKTHLSRAAAEGFYAVHKARPFFGELCDFMTRSSVVIAVLEKDNAVADYRATMGATDPAKAEAGTIRKLYAASIGENAVHGSDSLDNAKIEIAYFFPASEVAPVAG